jgi:hypothetical protein
MSAKREEKPRECVLLLNGKPASDAEYKRIVNGRARKSNPKDRATAPIETVSREFKLLR